MKKDRLAERRKSDQKGKLHIKCPFEDKTRIGVHVVVKDHYCYRSGECMVIECKYNRSKDSIENILSMTW